MDTISYLLKAVASGKSDPLVGVRSHEMWQIINRLVDELHARDRAINTQGLIAARASYGHESAPDTCPVCGAQEYNAYARCEFCHTPPHAEETDIQLELIHKVLHMDWDQLSEWCKAITQELGEI